MKNGFSQGLFISGELIFGGAFCFKMGWLDMTIKTANSNSSCAYIWEDSLSEGYLRLRFGWFVYLREGLLSEFNSMSRIELFYEICENCENSLLSQATR